MRFQVQSFVFPSLFSLTGNAIVQEFQRFAIQERHWLHFFTFAEGDYYWYFDNNYRYLFGSYLGKSIYFIRILNLSVIWHPNIWSLRAQKLGFQEAARVILLRQPVNNTSDGRPFLPPWYLSSSVKCTHIGQPSTFRMWVASFLSCIIALLLIISRRSCGW
jgi:hypothetical protein